MKLKLLFVLFILPTLSHARCNSNAIGVIHQSGFGISFGGGESSAGSYDKNTINVPLTIDGKQACFKKKTSYKIESKEKNKMVISPMELDFENIPAPHFKQYIFVQKKPDSLQTKIITMNFVCSGEIPLSTEAMTNSLFSIKASQEMEVNTSSTFASGVAAQNLGYRYKLNDQNNEALSFFAELYQAKKKKTEEELAIKPDCTEVSIPSLISQSNTEILGAVKKGITSEFSTLPKDAPNGCSQEFSNEMKNYLFENYVDNESLKDFKIKKKWFSKDLIFEWD